MLQNIRDKLTGPTALIFLGLIAIPFIFVGVGAPLLNSGYAAKVDGTEIPVGRFEMVWQNQLNQSPEILNYPAQYQTAMRKQILDRLILDTLVSNYLNDAGLQIGDRMVTDLIQQAPGYQEDGVFSMEKYRSELSLQSRDPVEFEATVKQQLRQLQLQQAIAQTAFVTPSEYRRYLNLFAETRVVDVATLSFEGIMDEVVISETDIQEFYDSKPEEFFTEESVDVEYVEIRRDALTSAVELTEEEVEQYYDQSGGRYLQDEQRQASHILIPFGDDEVAAEEQATAIIARINAGEPFEDLARQYSKDGMTSNNGGDLGRIMHSQMPDALGDSIFSMSKNEIKGPVRSDFGFHVVRLVDVIDGGPLPLEQVRGELEQELRDRKAEVEYRELDTALGNALFASLDMPAIAEAIGAEVQTVSEFKRTGGGAFGANQPVIDAVFDSRVLTDGKISDVIEIDANRTAVVRVAAHHQSVRKPLEEVSDQISGALKSARAQDIIADRSEELQAALNAGEGFTTAAEKVGATVARTAPVPRVDENMDQRLLASVFRVKKPLDGQPRVGSAVTQNGDFAIFSVSSVIPGRPEAIPLADRDARKQELATSSGTADFSAFLNEMYDSADIIMRDEIIEPQDTF